MSIATNEKSLLVLAAFDPELDSLRDALGPSMRGRVGDVVVGARSVGIGVAAATAGAGLLLAQETPQAVVLVGTAGAYDANGGLRIGDAGVVERFRLVDVAAVLGVTEVPARVGEEARSDEALTQGLACAGPGLPRIAVATTLGVTVDDDVAVRLAQASGADAEHMETYGVAASCLARAVPFACVLGIANVVGSQGRAQWRAHHVRASRAACQHVLRWLELGAAGLGT